MSAYNVAKAGVVSLSETLNVELKKYGIGVSVISPTVFTTSLGDGPCCCQRKDQLVILCKSHTIDSKV